MLTGYRCIVFALVGWLILSGANNRVILQGSNQSIEAQADHKISEAATTVANAINNTIEPVVHDTGCEDRQDRRNSDLCAQWKAADAAHLAATYAGWSIVIGIAGSSLLLWTLWETRQTARRQLRAYVSVMPAGLPAFQPGEQAIATIKLTNGGATPAYDLTQYGAVIVREFPLKSDPLENIATDRGPVQSRSTLHGHDKGNAHIHGPEPITQDEYEAVLRGDKVLYVVGNAEYRDTFDIKRRTEFSYFVSGDAIAHARTKARQTQSGTLEMRWGIANLHNHAT